jgi:hypothetical protein
MVSRKVRKCQEGDSRGNLVDCWLLGPKNGPGKGDWGSNLQKVGLSVQCVPLCVCGCVLLVPTALLQPLKFRLSRRSTMLAATPWIGLPRGLLFVQQPDLTVRFQRVLVVVMGTS